MAPRIAAAVIVTMAARGEGARRFNKAYSAPVLTMKTTTVSQLFDRQWWPVADLSVSLNGGESSAQIVTTATVAVVMAEAYAEEMARVSRLIFTGLPSVRRQK